MEEIFLLATTQMKQFISQMVFQRERDETSTHLFSLPPKAPPQERDSKTYDSDDSFNGKTSGVRGFYDSEHPDDLDFVGILIKT